MWGARRAGRGASMRSRALPEALTDYSTMCEPRRTETRDRAGPRHVGVPDQTTDNVLPPARHSGSRVQQRGARGGE